MTVTFFGHGDADVSIQKHLTEVVQNLIIHQQANTFYVGTHGNFDRMATDVLKKLKRQYPELRAYSVLSRMPSEGGEDVGLLETIFPEEVACTHPKNSISKRNAWMLERSDIVITYVIHSFGGAALFKNKALRQGKCVIELSEK